MNKFVILNSYKIGCIILNKNWNYVEMVRYPFGNFCSFNGNLC